MNLDKIIDQLCKDFEIPNNLKTEIPGVFSIPVETDFRIRITNFPPGFTMSSEICAVPKAKEGEFLEQAMIANVMAQATEGNVLGIDDTGKRLVLSRLVDWEIDSKDLEELLEDFTTAVDFWRDEAKLY